MKSQKQLFYTSDVDSFLVDYKDMFYKHVPKLKDIELSQESDLKHRRIRHQLRNAYSALCNVVWHHDEKCLESLVSWREAGGIIAEWTKEYDYLYYYLSGNEGKVSEWIEKGMQEKGWFCEASNIKILGKNIL